MAHYALIDGDNVVTQVITGRDEDDNVVDGVTYDWEEHYGEFHNCLCKRTSYNTSAGEHKYGGTPFRKNYAGIGYTWDAGRDAFIPPKPFESWTLNEDTCLWNAPVAYPTDGGLYAWNEAEQSWDEVAPSA